MQHKIEIKQAQGPSDIMWLNKGLNRIDKYAQEFVILMIIIIVALGVQYVFSAELQVMMYVNYRANPPFVDCSAIYNNIPDEIQQLAALEWL